MHESTATLKRRYVRLMKHIWYYEKNDWPNLVREQREEVRRIKTELTRRGVWLP